MKRWKLYLLAVFSLSGIDSLAQSPARPMFSGMVRTDASYIWQESDRYSNRPPWALSIYANPRFTYGKFTVNSLLQLGTFENKYRQAFNRVGVSPQYKWLTLHLGHRNYQYSTFTLNGRTLFGGGIELNPGKFRLGAVYGRLQRSIDLPVGDPDGKPAYTRHTWAARIGAGRPTNYADLIFLYAGDDSSSVNMMSDAQYPSPQENVAFGLITEQRIAKHFFLVIDGAISGFTRDVRVDTIRITEEFALRDKLLDIFHPRYSSQYFAAVHGGLEYRNKETSIAFNYDRIEPDYVSLAALTLINDRNRYNVRATWTMFEKKVRANINASTEENNVLNNRLNLTQKKQLNAGMNYAASQQFNFSLNYALYLLEQKFDDRRVSGSAMHTMTTSCRYKIDDRNTVAGNIMYNAQLNRVTGNTDLSNIFIRTSWDTQLNPRLGIGPEAGVGIFQFAAAGRVIRITPGCRVYSIGTGSKWSWQGGSTLNMNMIDGNVSYSTVNTNAGIMYLLNKNHQLSGRLAHAVLTGNAGYHEMRIDLSYTWRLGKMM